MNDISSLQNLIQTINKQNENLIIALIVLISVNIIIELIKIGGQYFLLRSDGKQKKQLLIDEKRIKILETLFKNLDRLSLYDQTQSRQMLKDIKDINLYISSNKLYIPKKFRSHANNILDYFKNVLSDYRQKNIQVETKLFEKFCNELEK